jgi:hypothetical protein
MKVNHEVKDEKISSIRLGKYMGRGQSFITGLPSERLQTCVAIYFPNLIEEIFSSLTS